MSQQQRLIQLPLVGITLLCLLFGVYLFTSKRFSKPDPENSTVKHSVDTHPDDVLNYWTAKKMRKAKPAPMPHVTDANQGKQHPNNPAQGSDSQHS